METESKSGFYYRTSCGNSGDIKNLAYPVKRNDIIGQARKSGAMSDICGNWIASEDKELQ
jgi:hypothetical protein